jgi:DedD protein
LAQDEYYYEIQLTNKQLVFYFLAGALGLILSFLLGIMVGKGVDNPNQDGRQVKEVREEPVVTLPNDEPSPAATAVPSGSLDYARRLESQSADASLERPPAPATPAQVVKTASVRATPLATRQPTPAPTAVPVIKPPAATTTPRAAAVTTPRTRPAATPPPGAPILTIQVGAYREKGAADTVRSRLKAKGYAAYVVSPAETSGGLFNVRVGSYSSRTDAERVKAKLEGQEKFKPFIVKQ